MRRINQCLLPGISRLIKTFHKAGIPTRSAALAYYSLLAVVPIIGMIFWYLKSMGFPPSWILLTKQFLLSQINVTPNNPFIGYIDTLVSPAHDLKLNWPVLFLIFFTAWNLVWKFGEDLDQLLLQESIPFHYGKVGLFKGVIRRTLILLILPIVLALTLALTHWIRRDSPLHQLFSYTAPWLLLNLVLKTGVSVIAFSLIYYFVPRTSVPWSRALKSALVVGPIAEILKFIFVLYGRHAVFIHKLYGIFVVIPLFIFWVWILWMILLCGAFYTQRPLS